MNQKRPVGVTIISIAAIIYGVLDIGQLFVPVITEERIEYSVPFLGILLLLFGIGTLALKEWARVGMIFGCALAIFQLALGIFSGRLPLEICFSLIFIILFGLVIFYFTRLKIKINFKKVNISSAGSNTDLKGE